VIPAIGDADARLDFSPAKRRDVDPFFSALIIHERLLMKANASVLDSRKCGVEYNNGAILHKA
jgi:hypothetical protein